MAANDANACFNLHISNFSVMMWQYSVHTVGWDPNDFDPALQLFCVLSQ